jgi:hypothetical protein
VIDDIRNFAAFFRSAPADELAIACLFLSVCCLAILFEWLWLRKRRQSHLLRLASREKTLRADATATTNLINPIRVATRESFAKLTARASKIASWISPSTHHTNIPDTIDTAQPNISEDCSTRRVHSQSQQTGEEDGQLE